MTELQRELLKCMPIYQTILTELQMTDDGHKLFSDEFINLFNVVYDCALRYTAENAQDLRKIVRRAMRIDWNNIFAAHNPGKKWKLAKKLTKFSESDKDIINFQGHASNIFVNILHDISRAHGYLSWHVLRTNMHMRMAIDPASYNNCRDPDGRQRSMDSIPGERHTIQILLPRTGRNCDVTDIMDFANYVNTDYNYWIIGVMLGGNVVIKKHDKYICKIIGNTTSKIRLSFSDNGVINESGLVIFDYSLAKWCDTQTGLSGLIPQFPEYVEQSYDEPFIYSKYHIFTDRTEENVLRIIKTGDGIDFKPIKKYRPYYKMYKRHGDRSLCNKVYLEPWSPFLQIYQLVWNNRVIYRGYMENRWQLHTDGWLYIISESVVHCTFLDMPWRSKKTR